MTTRSSALAAIRWTSSAMIGRAVIALAQIVAMSRILVPADFKLVAIAVTIVNVGIVFTDMGISNALIRFRDITAEELVSLFWLNIMTGAIVTLAVAAGSPAVAWFYGDPRLVPLVVMASSVFVITALGQQQRALAEKNLRFDILFRIDIAAALAGLAVAIAMALSGFGAASIVMGNVINALGVSALSWIMLADGFKPTLAFKWTTAKRFVSFGSNVVAISAFNALAANGDVMMGGRLLPGAALGYYFQPRDLCMRIMFVVNPIVSRVSFPLLASVAHDRQKVKSVYLKAMNMTASINFPIYAFVAVFSPEVVAIMLGPKWSASAPIMRLLAIWCGIRSIGNPVGSLLLATGETRRAMLSALAVALSILVFVFVGASFGVLGIPVALTLFYTLLIPGFWWALVRPACGAGFAEYHLVLLLPAVATACATVAGCVAISSVEAPVLRLIIGGTTGVAAYLISSWAVNREWVTLMSELLIANRLRKRFA